MKRFFYFIYSGIIVSYNLCTNFKCESYQISIDMDALTGKGKGEK